MTGPFAPCSRKALSSETQIIAFVLSADTENDPDVVGINAASAALTVSDIPFLGPVGAVRVGLVDGRFIANPTYTEMREGLLNIMVVGTAQAIVMIESGAKEVKEETVVDAIEFAHTEIKKICAGIEELRRKAGKPKRAGHAARIRSGLLKALEPKIGERLTDALDTEKHPKATSYELVGRCRRNWWTRFLKTTPPAASKLQRVFRDSARAHLPRSGDQEEAASGWPRLRSDSRDLD